MKRQALESLRLLAVLLAASVAGCGPATPQQPTTTSGAGEAGAANTGAPRDRPAADLLIFGGTVVTMDAQRQVFENGAVAIIDGAIAAVGALNAGPAAGPRSIRSVRGWLD